MSTEDTWFFLSMKISEGVDVYSIAKKNGLLKKGMTKKIWEQGIRGVIMGHLSQQIREKPELKELFKSRI